MFLKIKYSIILLLILSAKLTFAQTKSAITIINYEFHHSKRYVNATLKINIENNPNDSCRVHLQTFPLVDDDKWNKSKMDRNFTLSQATFDSLVVSVMKINQIQLDKAIVFGKDGTTCKIEFGNLENKVAYQFWTPHYNEQQRGLQLFIQIASKILKSAKLNPEEFL